MLITQSHTKKLQPSDACELYEYPFHSEKMSIATAMINGRHPGSGKNINLVVEEVYYVVSGTGTIYSDRGTFEIHEGDLYHFEAGESFYVEGDNLKIVLANAPTWSEEQHQHIE